MHEDAKERFMLDRGETSWTRAVLLLSSFAAGYMATLLTPPYRDIAALANERRSVAAAQEEATPDASDMSRSRTHNDASRTL
jgi:hypothetical protein